MKGPDAPPFRILSLDGGGIRGAFIAGFLARIEEVAGIRIADHFDLIAGTSTGAIIAAALAVHEPASKVVEFYSKRGPVIFERRPKPASGGWRLLKSACIGRITKKFGIEYDHLVQTKYSPRELKGALDEVFGGRLIGDAKTRLLIPAVDLTRGQTIVFKTPHFPGLFRDRHYKLADVLMATTAAPTYFPHASIGNGTAYVDGGLWVNNPSVAAIAEAMKIRDTADRTGLDRPIDLERIYLLSVGTGKATYFSSLAGEESGILWWAPKFLNISSVAQSQGINFQATYFLGDRAHRIDYDLPDGRWSLDSVDVLEEMITIGRERANERLAAITPTFFSEKAGHPYHPFG